MKVEYRYVTLFFLEGVIDPFHLEYFIKTFVQANHPRFKLELKCIFLKRGQNVGEFVFVPSEPLFVVLFLSFLLRFTASDYPFGILSFFFQI
jgi:hypothetical protein